MNNKQKKIAFISNYSSPYQVENCKYLNEKTGNEYFFIFCQKIHGRPNYWNVVPFTEKNIIRLDEPLLNNTSFYFNKSISKELDNLNPDVVICGGYLPFTNLVAAIWAKKRNKRSILFMEKFNPGENFIKKGLKKLYLKGIASFYTQIFAVGTDGYKEYKYLKKDIQIVPYILNRERYFQEHEYSSKVRFLYSGRFTKNHNILNIVNAFIDLSKKYDHLELILSGHGDEYDNILNISKTHKNIYIDNNYSSWFELTKLYEKADVLLAPLNDSGWGFVVEEAMCNGLAIISGPDVSAGNDLVIDGYNGFIVPPKKDDIKDAMRKYILNKQLIQIHGKNSQDIMRQVDYQYMINKFDGSIKYYD